jgi:hypothetical protein
MMLLGCWNFDLLKTSLSVTPPTSNLEIVLKTAAIAAPHSKVLTLETWLIAPL